MQAEPAAGGRQHRRYELLRDLAKGPTGDIILTTATPHSGIEESFRSLLGLLDADFDADEETEVPRRRLSPHIIQRRSAVPGTRFTDEYQRCRYPSGARRGDVVHRRGA